MKKKDEKVGVKSHERKYRENEGERNESGDEKKKMK